MKIMMPYSSYQAKKRMRKIQHELMEASSSFQYIISKQISRSDSPPELFAKSQQSSKESSKPTGIQSIKAEIHKLRTESPNFTKFSLAQERSKSYFFDRSPKIKKLQDQKSMQAFMKLAYKHSQRHRDNKSYLPELNINQAKRNTTKISHFVDEQTTQYNSNVILLKRNMRYRLDKLPNFVQAQRISERQPNISITGWNKNPQEIDEFDKGLYNSRT